MLDRTDVLGVGVSAVVLPWLLMLFANGCSHGIATMFV